MVLIIKNVLSKLQVMRYIKRDVIYGPVYLQVMRYKNLYTLLGATHLSLVAQFFNTDTDLGRLIEAYLECLTVELGLTRCHLSYNKIKDSDCATKSWMKYLWKYCLTCNIIIKRNTSFSRVKCVNNRNLMKYFIGNGYHGIQLAAINRCRLFFQAIHLSDITSDDGTHNLIVKLD